MQSRVGLRIFQLGYMDNQLPPIIVGGLLIVPTVTVASSPETNPAAPAAVVYLLVAIGLICFAWGMHVNAESLKYPESPFNRHASPWLITFVVVACSAHAAWVTFNGPFAELTYVFVVVIVAALGFFVRTVTRPGKTAPNSKLP